MVEQSVENQEFTALILSARDLFFDLRQEISFQFPYLENETNDLIYISPEG